MDDSVLNNRGLVTQYNPLKTEVGFLVRADNAVMLRENVIENRRGYEAYATLANQSQSYLQFGSTTLVHNGTEISLDNGTGGFSDYDGTFEPPTADRKIYGQEDASNLYITTDVGIQVLMDTTPAFTITGDLTNGSNVVTNVSSTANLFVGKSVSATQLPVGTFIAEINNSTLTLSQDATATASGVTLTVRSRARAAGAPRALSFDYSLTGSTGFLNPSSQCAYTTTFTRVDQNQNQVQGVPSERVWVPNTAGASRDVALTVYLPSNAMASDILEIFRTEQVAGILTDDSGTTYKLAFQKTVTQADIVAGQVVVTDSVEDDLLGAPIYTAPGEEGSSQANEEPPLAKDIALFRQHMFYANTETKQRLFFSLISSEILGLSASATRTSGNNTLTSISTTGIVAGMQIFGTGIAAGATVVSVGASTITMSANATASGTSSLEFITNRTLTIANSTYSFSNTQNSPNGVVDVSTTNTAAFDIDQTARNLVKAINLRSTNTNVYAYYVSGPADLPGQILIEERTVGGAAFTMAVSNSVISTAFFPNPPTSPATLAASTSSNSQQRNAIYVSKFNQREAVPALNVFYAGPANKAILRIIALKDSVIVVSEGGIYRIAGDSINNFDVTPLDLTVFCKSVDSVRTLANRVFMLSNQGIVAITDTGVQVVSRDVEPEIVPLLLAANLNQYTTALTYESDREYILSTVTSANDNAPTQTFVYNVFTRAWTKWDYPIAAGIVNTSSDKIFFSKPSDLRVYRERKDFSDNDYADPEVSINITAISGAVVTFTIATGEPEAGWVIVQNNTELKIESVEPDADTWVATMEAAPPAAWVVGPATAFPPVDFDVEWGPYSAGAPGTLKQLQDFKLLSDTIGANNTISSIDVSLRTDLDKNRQFVTIESNATGWGDSWGEIEWGGVAENNDYRTWPPRNKAYFRILTPGFRHHNAKERCSINGYAVKLDGVSERTNK